MKRKREQLNIETTPEFRAALAHILERLAADRPGDHPTARAAVYAAVYALARKFGWEKPT